MKAGFTFLGGNDRMLDQANLAGALGTVEVRPLDMTTAFGAFGNGGKVTKPRYILKVEAPDGDRHLRGRQAHHQAGLEARHGLHHGRHPRRATRTEPSTRPGVRSSRCTTRGTARAARRRIKTGTTNELQGLLDLRPPADAQEQEAARARGRRLVRQQRQLEPQPRSPALLDGQRRPDLGGLREGVHEGQAGPRVQATEGWSCQGDQGSTSSARSPAALARRTVARPGSRRRTSR